MGVRFRLQGTDMERNSPERRLAILRDSRVLEHLDTKSIADPTSRRENKHTTILLKCKPFGRSNSPWETDWKPPSTCSSRHPVNLGEVRGLVHVSATRGMREVNARSSRRGREQIRPKVFESGVKAEIRRSDLMTAEILCSKTR